MTAGRGKYKAMKKAWLEFNKHHETLIPSINRVAEYAWIRGFNTGWKKGRRNEKSK